MGTIIAGGRPDDQNVPVVQNLGRQDRRVARPHGGTAPPYPSLCGIAFLTIQADRRPHGPALRLGDTDDDVTAVEVLMIVGERTDRLQHLEAGGIGIPARLELDAHGLDGSTTDEIIDVDGQDGAHGEIVAVAEMPINEPSA